VQIVHSTRRGSREITHMGSARTDAEVEVLKAAAWQRLAAGQGELDLGLNDAAGRGGPLPITASRMGHLWDGLARAYDPTWARLVSPGNVDLGEGVCEIGG